MSLSILENNNVMAKFEKVQKFSGFDQKLYDQVWSRLCGQGFPTLKTDDWKYTNIQPIMTKNFKYPEYKLYDFSEFDKYPEYSGCYRLFFINGVLQKNELAENKTVSVEHFNLAQPAVSLDRTQLLNDTQSSFDLLNFSLSDRGIKITIKKNSKLDKPIALINISLGEPLTEVAFNSFIQINCAENSKLQLIEANHSKDKEVVFNNFVTEIKLSKNAKLEYLKLQRENKTSFHMHQVFASVHAHASLTAFNLSTGSALNRNNIYSRIDGEGGSVHLNGLYLTNEKQLIDNKTYIEHASPHTNSNQLYKGVLDGSSRGVFNGVIRINEGSDQVDSSQMVKNLILSDKAEADTKPELQVFADDVKANHGSAIGELDISEIFYFQSRGISKKQAVRMLTKGYLEDVAFKINHEVLRQIVDINIENVMHEFFEDLS